MKMQMKDFSRQLLLKKKEMGPVIEENVNSQEYNLSDVECFEEYDANYSDLYELYGNQSDEDFHPNE